MASLASWAGMALQGAGFAIVWGANRGHDYFWPGMGLGGMTMLAFATVTLAFGSAMLGLTLGCARCHDHKYDPVPRRDYYRMLSAFNGGDRAQVPLAPLEAALRYRDAEMKWKGEFDPAKKRLEEWIKEARKPHETAVRHAKVMKRPF